MWAAGRTSLDQRRAAGSAVNEEHREVLDASVARGAATAGLVGREGEILRRTLGVCLGYTALGGILTWVLARFAN